LSSTSNFIALHSYIQSLVWRQFGVLRFKKTGIQFTTVNLQNANNVYVAQLAELFI